jgi:hypothetical protein
MVKHADFLISIREAKVVDHVICAENYVLKAESGGELK